MIYFQAIKRFAFVCILSVGCMITFTDVRAQLRMTKALPQLQQEFVDLRFGMFIHYNIPTYMDQDWADPEASPSLFNPSKLDCDQWAKAAVSANMRYGCLTTKHHSGFTIWNTETTDYNVMNSPLKRDVVKEYTDAFRAKGLKVMLYYSILDTHHKLRPNYISNKHIEMVKAQLTELLTNYGEITAVIIDGWDAPWSRISYDDIPFEEIYTLVKSIQPDCLLMDLNAAKYPAEALFYTDIKSYEQGAGQMISKESNNLPALSCLPLNSAWFWKTDFPKTPVKNPIRLVTENLIPLNDAHCNFILNVAPNRDGLIDENALQALAEIGKNWKGDKPLSKLPPYDAPLISSNLAKHKKSNASWSNDMWIMDFANDDDFGSAWASNPTVKEPWYEVEFDKPADFNMIVLTQQEPVILNYKIEYYDKAGWHSLLTKENPSRIIFHRFKTVSGERVKISILRSSDTPVIAEFGIYNEKLIR